MIKDKALKANPEFGYRLIKWMLNSLKDHRCPFMLEVVIIPNIFLIYGPFPLLKQRSNNISFANWKAPGPDGIFPGVKRGYFSGSYGVY